ncbi:hypothetical protein NP493_1904g00000 [Ridgeia piscesae]|uniref:Uncharacterized protein n=1 Tax=Ridgeia piscesae TaxID=27915 RepID=A0AAD9JPS4_RIDPI|nr:hypothetical protein NP493_1904g00000 [Ridgeia piscesae]
MASETASLAGCRQHRKLTDALLDIAESEAFRDGALIASAILANNGVELVSPWQATATLSVRVRTKKRKSYNKSHQADDGCGDYGPGAKLDASNCYPAWRIGVDPITYNYVVDNGRYRAVKLARKMEIQTGVRRNTEKLSPEQKSTQPDSKCRHRDAGSDRPSEDSCAVNSPRPDTDRVCGVGLPSIRRYPPDIQPDITTLAAGDFSRTNSSQKTPTGDSNSVKRSPPKTRPDSASFFDLPVIEVPLTTSFGCRSGTLQNCRPFDDTIIAHVQRLEVKSSKLYQNGEQRSRSEPVPVMSRCDALSMSYQSKHAVPLSLHPIDTVQRRPTPEPMPLFPVRVSEAMKEARIDIQKLSPKPTSKPTVSTNGNGYGNNTNGYVDLHDFTSDSSQREFGLIGWTKSKKSPRKTTFPGHHLRNDAQPGNLNGALIYRSDTVGEDMFSVKRIDTTLEQRNARHSFNDVLGPRERSPPTAPSNGTSTKTYAPLASAVSTSAEAHESIWNSASANAPRYVYKHNTLSKELQHRFITSTKIGGHTPERNSTFQAKAKTGRTGHRKRTKGKNGANVEVVSGGFMGVLIGQTRQRTRKSRSERDILPEISGQRIKSKLTADAHP